MISILVGSLFLLSAGSSKTAIKDTIEVFLANLHRLISKRCLTPVALAAILPTKFKNETVEEAMQPLRQFVQTAKPLPTIASLSATINTNNIDGTTVSSSTAARPSMRLGKSHNSSVY